MVNDNDLLKVAARIQEAAWFENGRISIIKTVSEHLGSVGGVFMDFDYRKGEFVHISNFGLPPVEQDFLDELEQNPDFGHSLFNHSLNHEYEHTIRDYDLQSEEEIQRDGYYDWLQRAARVKYFIGSRLNAQGPNAYLLGLQFTRAQGHASDQQAKHCELLRPHLANAFRITALREQMDDAKDFAELVSANSPHGLVGIDQRGVCNSINEAADRIFSQNDGITLDPEGRLLISDSESAARIGKQISKAVYASREGDIYAGGEEVVPRTSGHGLYMVRVTPGLRLRYGYDVGVPVVILTVTDPASRNKDRRRKLMHLFELTNREAEVVDHILTGIGLPRAASRMGISHNTARVHLQNVFAKTNCRSQAEIISNIGGLL